MERLESKVEECNFLAKPSIKAEKLSYIKGSKPIYANLFKITIEKNWVIYKYPVSFLPEIAKDNPRMKRALFAIAEPQIKKVYGECFLSGEMLYSFSEVKEKQEFPFKARGEIDYKFVIDPYTNCFSINDENPLQNPAIKQIYELIFKEILRANPHLEFYRNLFVKSNEVKSISSNRNKIDFYPGFASSIIYTPYGPFLNVTIKNKILSTSTCYEIILTKKRSKGKFTKEEEEEIREYFSGRSVKTTYNRKNYVIDDVSFDKTPKTTTINKDGNNLVLVNYYKVAHGITIKNVDQPLLVVNKIGSNNEKITLYIVPELCKIAGIDDTVTKDGQFMKALAAYTKLTPKERVAKTNDFFHLINESTQRVITDKKSKVINKELSSLEKKKIFQLNLLPAEKNNFTANYMETPTLTAGKNKQISAEERKPVAVSLSKDLTNWLCVYHKDNFNDANLMLESLQKASKSYEIKVSDPEWLEMNSMKADDWKDNVDDYIKQKKYDIVVFILDNYLDKLYKEIKKHSLSFAGYNSQVIKPESLNRNAMSVASKILLQINYKLGGYTYKVNFAKDVTKQNLMIVGIDSSHIAGKRTGVAMVATMNNDFTEYYNKIDIIPESKKETLVFCVASFLKEAISKYYEANKKRNSKTLVPSGIVIYRQGVSREQKLFLKSEEKAIRDFLNGVDEDGMLKSSPIPYFYVLVNTKTNYKFFESTKQKNVVDYLNPSAGLLVMDDVTDPNFFEFYIQPQIVTQGTATPTCFHVAFGNMKSPEIIPKLTYDLCFLYANWQGPVRVPGPLKAAEKLSKMTAKFTKAELNEKLKTSQAYL
jgi:aubergine-like protein